MEVFFPSLLENVKQKAKNQENADKSKVEKFSENKGYEGFIFKLLEAESRQTVSIKGHKDKLKYCFWQ